MSGGTIFCVLFFVSCLIYFVGGVVLRKFMRGAEGLEIFPHYEFWTGLPSLITDGVLFTLNGCKPEVSYERI